MARFFVDRQRLVFAHRGGSGLAPENTIVAFDTGLAFGADGLELDVHLSRDGRVVVHHDRTLDRTTNLQGFVADRTADELARADAAYRFGQNGSFPFRGKAGGVPLLADVLARYRDRPIVIELKVNTPALARAVVEAVRRADAVDQVKFLIRPRGDHADGGLPGGPALRFSPPGIDENVDKRRV